MHWFFFFNIAILALFVRKAQNCPWNPRLQLWMQLHTSVMQRYVHDAQLYQDLTSYVYREHTCSVDNISILKHMFPPAVFRRELRTMSTRDSADTLRSLPFHMWWKQREIVPCRTRSQRQENLPDDRAWCFLQSWTIACCESSTDSPAVFSHGLTSPDVWLGAAGRKRSRECPEQHLHSQMETFRKSSRQCLEFSASSERSFCQWRLLTTVSNSSTMTLRSSPLTKGF